jgi:hypothetical protein
VSNSVPFFYDTKKGAIIELTDGMVVGRNKNCDVAVVDHRVSGMHFKIQVKEDKVFIIDLESSNKTKLNGEEIDAKVEMKLSIKDNIKFGDQKFLFFFECIEDFAVPEVTSTLKIRSTADCADDLFQSSSLEVVSGASTTKKKTKVSELRVAKGKLSELDTNMQLVKEEFEDFLSLKQSYNELVDKIANSQDQLDIAGYKSKEEVENDIQNYDFSISELNESINEAKQKIEGWSKQITMINQNILEARHFSKVFEDLNCFKTQQSDLTKEIDEKEKLNLEEKHNKSVAEFESAQENYKELQEDYSNSVGVKKKKAA